MKVENGLFANLQASRGVDWFVGTSDWGATAAGIRVFRTGCDAVGGLGGS